MTNRKNDAVVLLVDDDQSFSRQTHDYLTAEGFCVHTENNGNEAIKAVDKIKPDVLILDINLGLEDTDGRIICQQVSQTERYQQGVMGIIMISGHYINPSDELFGYNAGADNYLTKPFGMAQLTARLYAVLRLVNVQETHEPDTGEQLSIDYKRYEVRVNGTLIQLSPLEYRLLVYLVRADGRVCLKGELLEEVWHTVHVEEGAIAKCVSILRGKFRKQLKHDFIKNQHGVGYQFDPGRKSSK